MPKEITHWLIAEQVLQTLDAALPLKQIIHGAPNHYLLGAVLPDSPLYMKLGSGAREMLQLAQSIHDAPDSLAFLKDYLKACDGDIGNATLALVLGMVTHFFADSMFHPFVSFFAGPDSARHFFMETHIDLALLPPQAAVQDYLFATILAAASQESALLRRELTEIFSILRPVSPAAIKKMLWQHAFFQAKFDRRYVHIGLHFLSLLPGTHAGLYLALCYPRKKPAPDQLFPREYHMLHPVTGEGRSFTLSALYKQTVQSIVDCFAALHDKKNLLAAFSDLPAITANTGIAGKSSADMHYFSSEKNLTKIIL